MRTFVIGDIHGAYKALVQCLERSGFNKEEDLLITLGDLVDGWSEVVQVVDELLTIKNRIDIRGNHDQWFMDWYLTGIAKQVWLSQGGQATFDAYTKLISEDIDKFHLHIDNLFNRQDFYYLDGCNRLFVHGGCNWKIPLEENRMDDLMWDRHMYEVALYHEVMKRVNDIDNKFSLYNEIFIGHTTTQYKLNWRFPDYGTNPIHATNLWNLDTGAGWSGKLSIMNVETKEFWQSDLVTELYKGERGRD